MGRLSKHLLGLVAALVTVSPAAAEGLQRVDMAQLPLAGIKLLGGSYVASLEESRSPYKSQLLITCQDCAKTTDALVGLVAASPRDAADFARDPEAYLQDLNAICLSQAAACALSQSTVGGLKGYAFTARYADGFFVVEHTYFSNGLLFVINASGPSLDVAKSNVASLIRAAGPFVTGQNR